MIKGMHKWMSIAAACFASCGSLFADCGCREASSSLGLDVGLPYNCPVDDWPSSFNAAFGSGYRVDKVSWRISGPSQDEYILSKLNWKNLQIIEVGGYAKYVSCTNYAIRISGDYGGIYHGRNVDSDYLVIQDDDGDDTDKFLTSQSRNNAGRGKVYDFEAGVGYRVTSTGGRFVATPQVGYSWHGQKLHLYDGDQTFDLFHPERVGPIEGLNSTYSARWFGPWVGMDFAARVEACTYIFGSFEWHWVSYRGTGRWNLREDMGPFQQRANGYGYIATLGGTWEIWRHVAFGLNGTYRNMRTSSGHESYTDYSYYEPIRVRFPFDQAKWSSVSVSAIITWRY